MKRYTVAVLVNNQYGVLNRVTSMFRRRQFNISALTVSETETSKLSRITVVFDGEESVKQQIINQLYKLPDVYSIKELDDKTSVSCELLAGASCCCWGRGRGQPGAVGRALGSPALGLQTRNCRRVTFPP